MLIIYNVSLLITLAHSTVGMQKLSRESDPLKATGQREEPAHLPAVHAASGTEESLLLSQYSMLSRHLRILSNYLELTTSKTVNLKAPFACKGKCCFKVQNLKVLWIHRNSDPWFQETSNAVCLDCLFLGKDYSQGFLVCFCMPDSCPQSRGGA